MVCAIDEEKNMHLIVQLIHPDVQYWNSALLKGKLSRDKMLAAYSFAFENVFCLRVAATYRLYPLFSPLSCQFFFEGRLILYNGRYSIKSNPFVPITSAATAENYTKNHFLLGA